MLGKEIFITFNTVGYPSNSLASCICRQWFQDKRTISACRSGINSHSFTKLLQPANLATYTILSLFRLQVDLASHLLSP